MWLVGVMAAWWGAFSRFDGKMAATVAAILLAYEAEQYFPPLWHAEFLPSYETVRTAIRDNIAYQKLCERQILFALADRQAWVAALTDARYLEWVWEEARVAVCPHYAPHVRRKALSKLQVECKGYPVLPPPVPLWYFEVPHPGR